MGIIVIEMKLSILFIISICHSILCLTRNSQTQRQMQFLQSSKSTIISKGIVNVDAQNALSWVEKNIDKISIFAESPSKLSLTVDEIGGGNTNFNYVIRDLSSGRAAFVKHAKAFAKGFGESAPMSTLRLGYEYYGMNEFSKYGFTVPESYYYDPVENYLSTSYLDGYEPFLVRLQHLEVDMQVAQALGAIMGMLLIGLYTY